MTPKERLSSWRAEIAAELEEATKLVPPLEEARATTSDAAHAALEDYRAVQRLIGPVISQPEGPFMSRMNAHLADVEQAKSRRARALADLQAARTTVTKLQRALNQIDRVIPPAEEAAA